HFGKVLRHRPVGPVSRPASVRRATLPRKTRHRARLAAVDDRFILAPAARGAGVHGAADAAVLRGRAGAGLRGGADPPVRPGPAGGAGALLCMADPRHAAAGAVVRDLL